MEENEVTLWTCVIVHHVNITHRYRQAQCKSINAWTVI